MSSLMAKLRQQVLARWLTPMSTDAFGDEALPASGDEAAPEAEVAKARREVLLAEEGSTDSLITPGFKLPSGGATIMDVLEVARIHKERGIPASAKVAWTATQEECAAAGVKWTFGKSVLLHPIFSAELMMAVRAEMGTEHHVRHDDTMATLQARLATALIFDDIHAAAGGHGKGGRTVPLNGTAMAQPRRSSQSVRGSPVFTGASAPGAPPVATHVALPAALHVALPTAYCL
jgi:hypothetical protein